MWSSIQSQNVSHQWLARCSVTIDVYRIYLGCTWADAAAVDRLTRGLDAVPGLLYRLDRPAPASPASLMDPEETRALMRIAMTQSHACLVSGDGAAMAADALAIELDLARHAFRRRIPVVLIADPGRADHSTVDADVTVSWCPTSIATTLQQVVEEAAAERRAHYRSIAAQAKTQTRPDASSRAGGDGRAANSRDSLPIADIMQAFDELRARRGGANRNQP